MGITGMMNTIRFGAAQVIVNQAALDHFTDKSDLYIEYKEGFNALTALKNKATKRLNRLSEQTEIKLYGDSWYYVCNKDYFKMDFSAKVSTKDVERDQIITRSITKKKREPMVLFWRRVLKIAEKMDQVLSGPKNPDKKGNYTMDIP